MTWPGTSAIFRRWRRFRLMWLTLCRPSEVMGARWEEFDLEAAIWRIPPERMKKRKEHVVPLPQQAVDLLRTVQGFTGHGARVPESRQPKQAHVRCDAAAGIGVPGMVGEVQSHTRRARPEARG